LEQPVAAGRLARRLQAAKTIAACLSACCNRRCTHNTSCDIQDERRNARHHTTHA
jgi:hypothetical protein